MLLYRGCRGDFIVYIRQIKQKKTARGLSSSCLSFFSHQIRHQRWLLLRL